jgi:hypothetical protein
VVRRRLFGVVIVIGLATVVGLLVWWPRGDSQVDRETLGFGPQANATVTGSEVGACSYDETGECNRVSFEVTSGPAEGMVGEMEFDTEARTPASELDEG